MDESVSINYKRDAMNDSRRDSQMNFDCDARLQIVPEVLTHPPQHKFHACAGVLVAVVARILALDLPVQHRGRQVLQGTFIGQALQVREGVGRVHYVAVHHFECSQVVF